LIDSGSSASFLSTSVAQWLSAVSLLPAPTQVQVTGGGIIQSPEILNDIQWTFDQYSFRSNFRLLPLTAYDVIIGMDWLEAHSPMHVHWLQKWLAIPYQGQLVLLQGLDSISPSHLYIQLCAVQDATPQEQQAVDVPPEIQLLLQKFSSMFEEPTELPPSQACNHRIPPIPSAQPIFTRPYRYPPGLKDEIERQVGDMLAEGLIQPSHSPFLPRYCSSRKRMDPIGSALIFVS